MKQIKNKLYKLDKEIKFLQDLENAHIEVSKNNIKNLEKNIEKKVDNLLFKYSIVFAIIIIMLGSILISNLVLTSELYEQYHIEECTCNE